MLCKDSPAKRCDACLKKPLYGITVQMFTNTKRRVMQTPVDICIGCLLAGQLPSLLTAEAEKEASKDE